MAAGSGEDKGLIDLLGDAFDECAETVEEVTGRPAPRLRKSARICRKAKKTAKSVAVASQKMQAMAAKSSVPKVINKIKDRVKDVKIVGYQPYVTEEQDR